ncbi:hypothetical protein ACFYQQ_18760 [Streptomyces sp. NPDC005496]|uniref:hypothetical protein n=1 Tax=unclassified Streptomyces TaxID=2593676 RepID=UPI0033B1B5D4
MRRLPIRDRRGALLGASAAVVCLGAVAVTCGGGGLGGGYVAVGPAGGPPGASGAAAPTGDVTLAPLDEEGGAAPPAVNRGADQGRSDPASSSAPGTGPTRSPGAQTRGPGATTEDGTERPGSAGAGGDSGRPGAGSGGGTATEAPASPPAGPAVLTAGEPRRAAGEHRWCEEVTVSFRNTGGTAVRSGTVTFGTHVVGALGIDWATVESTEDLPAPIAAGAVEERTWTVCVDAWRVPLGMHVETRDVSVRWR